MSVLGFSSGCDGEHLLPTLLELCFLCTNLSSSLLLICGTFFPHSLLLPIRSVLAYSSGFPAPDSSSTPSFLSSFSFFYPLSHAQPIQTHASHLWSQVPPSGSSSNLPLSFPHHILSSSPLHLVRQDVFCTSPLGCFSPLAENGIWDLCPIK